MRKIAANFAPILLFAITLFFLGPQFGSLDIDGDGIADVPVMVMHESAHQKVQLPQSKSQTKVGLATASPFLGLMCNDVVLMKERIVVEPRGSNWTQSYSFAVRNPLTARSAHIFVCVV